MRTTHTPVSCLSGAPTAGWAKTDSIAHLPGFGDFLPFVWE
jgi:hypothetical protein